MATSTQRWVGRLCGLGGAVLVALAAARIASIRSAAGGEGSAAAAPAPEAAPAALVVAADRSAPVAPAVAEAVRAQPALYPLQVGRYWVYRHQEPGSDLVTQEERTIVRRQPRTEGVDLYFYDDGSVVYYENGRIFEMGSNGGVNIIPLEMRGQAEPVVYRSQGMQIEKWLGAADTTLVIGGRRFDGCLEVVTRFHALEGEGTRVSYSSFYAPGIGMVGRQTWPRDERGSLAVTLADHGTRSL